MNIKDRLIGSGKISTIAGGVLGTAIAGAAKYGEASGWNVSSWQGYAAGAVVALALAAVKGKKK